MKPRLKFESFPQYYKYFSFLIDKEREATISNLREELKLPPKERERSGKAILDLKVDKIKKTYGMKYEVILVRDEIIKENEINIGDLVILSTDPFYDPIEGVLSFKDKKSIGIIVNEPVNFKDKLRVDLYCNETTFRRMKKALNILAFKKEIFRILSGRAQPRFKEEKITIKNSYLNEFQREVVKKTLLARDIFLIQGPPGTGKTTTIAASIYEHSKRGYRILACADSNTAVDNLIEALFRYNLKVVRIGHPGKVLPSILEHTLDFLIEKNNHFKEAKIIRDEIERIKENQKQIKTSFSKIKINKNKDFEIFFKNKKEIKRLMKLALRLERAAIKETIMGADVVCATNSGAGSEILENFNFDVVFIDEANQSTEPSCLIPIVKGKKIIMAGDHQQLPPTVVNEKISPYLSLSLFERMVKVYGKDILGFLKVQYRMNEKILNFSNYNFYQAKIISSPDVKNRLLEDIVKKPLIEKFSSQISEILNPRKPICFVDIESKEDQYPGATSIFNKTEAIVLKIIYEKLLELGLKKDEIGIISPYKDQTRLLKEIIGQDVEIKTVDGFQGREKEVIIISLVRANEDKKIGFLSERKRLNVALTRAKRKLIAIGNANTLKSSELYRRLLYYFSKNNSYIKLDVKEILDKT